LAFATRAQMFCGNCLAKRYAISRLGDVVNFNINHSNYLYTKVWSIACKGFTKSHSKRSGVSTYCLEKKYFCP